MSALERIKKQVTENSVMLYMKGNTRNANVWFLI